MYVCMYVCLYVFLQACKLAHIHASTYIDIFVCCVYMSVCVNAYMYLCICL